jgi:KaiC/GvpD/RAD55 family RecA-like ATPase
MQSKDQEHGSQIAPLMFGIPQLDELFGYRDQDGILLRSDKGGEVLKGSPIDAQQAGTAGKSKVQDIYGSLRRTSSMTIVGEDGTGKSVVALHLASRYLALHYRACLDTQITDIPHEAPLVLYASSDFRYSAAQAVWKNFYLDYPWLRYVPFIRANEKDFRAKILTALRDDPAKDPFKIELVSCEPSQLVASVHNGKRRAENSSDRQVTFIDLASQSTGDDWRYLSSLLAALPRNESRPSFTPLPNLLILDSVAGFETLIGTTNTFGQESTRRGRISQILKAAGDSWHIVFVSEEPDQTRHHPEEYVTDTVIHLRRHGVQEKVRRYVEIEKSRARNLAQGEHPFEIRDGRGTSTRSWENPDDPQTVLHPQILERLRQKDPDRNPFSSYVQIFPSLHYLSKQYGARQALMRDDERSRNKGPKIPFGIDYLDDLFLPSESENAGGLPGGTTTALIGEEGTRKVYLAEEFLIAAYGQLPQVFALMLRLCKGYRSAKNKSQDFCAYIRTRGISVLRTMPQLKALDDSRLQHSLSRFGEGLYDVPFLDAMARSTGSMISPGPEDTPLKTRWSLANYVDSPISNPAFRTDESKEAISLVTLALSALRLLTGTLMPSVFVTTHDNSRENLVDRIVKRHRARLIRTIKEYAPLDESLLTEYLVHLRRVVENWIIVRRIELVDLTSPQLWHVIDNAVIHGINGLGYNISDIYSNLEPTKFAEQVRVVISDLRLLRDTYPAVATDPLFLPTIVFRLKRLGVTTIIVESDSGRFDDPPSHSMSGALRSLVDQQVNTWKVNFFGEQRVAIAVLPSAGTSNACLIRELRYENTLDGDDISKLIVDPVFEIFENVEDGKPTAVGLQIHFYNETPAFRRYVESEQNAFNLIFSPEAKDDPGVLRVVAHSEYSALRDYTNLPTSKKLPFSLVFMVDGFWALGHANALMNQHEYLFRKLPAADSSTRFEDPFKLYIQGESIGDPSNEPCRADMFKQSTPAVPGRKLSGYENRVGEGFTNVDRVPFMWDFGFLLCSKDQWDRASGCKLQITDGSGRTRRPSVAEVFSKLRFPSQIERHMTFIKISSSGTTVSWREFLEACKLVGEKEGALAQKTCRVFDVSSTSPESLTCLMLEVWLSEVFSDLMKFEKLPKGRCPKLDEAMREWCKKTRRDLSSVSSKIYDTQVSTKPRLQEWLQVNPLDVHKIPAAVSARKRAYGVNSPGNGFWSKEEKGVVERFCLVQGVGGYSIQLYQAWLLLLEVLDFSSFLDTSPIERSAARKHDDGAVAVRHWYKTACDTTGAKLTGATASKEHWSTKVPIRLPGHFSARGDWFLATAKGSRSVRLAEQAIDLLSSRRGNRTRLLLGLGLPVRDIVPGKEIGKIRTGLTISTSGEKFFLSYENILEMGGTFFSEAGVGLGGADEDFFWLFRTGLQNYDKQSVAVSRWLQKMFAWTVQLRFKEAHNWDGGFRAYDDLTRGSTKITESYQSWGDFFEYLKVFQADLNACVQDY